MSNPTPSQVEVITTYLHLPSPELFRPSFVESPDVLVLQAQDIPADFYRFLYKGVGRTYQWIDRNAWTDERLETHLARPTVAMHVLYVRGVPAGYIELDQESEEPGTEIVYFGLMPAFHGRGLGKHLLSTGVQWAYQHNAQRIWLHTCSLDGPYALANYQARGFVPYRTTTHTQTLA
jgi:GNAT superfamily N-acetyltransferase